MSGGTPTRRSGVAASLNYPTLQTENPFTIPRSELGDSSVGEADITAVPIPGRSGEQPPGLSNVAQFNPAPSHPGTFPDHVLDNPERFDDAPYIPPRAEPPTYPALDPRITSVYDPTNHDFQHYPYEGGTSPSESLHSVDWSTSSSSSTSSQQLIHDYSLEPTSQYSQTPRPPRATSYPQYYPAYHGQHRLGLEHVRYGEQPSNTGGPYYRTPPQGYSIDNLLAPEIYDDTSTHATMASQMHYLSTSPQASSSSSSISATNRPSNISTFSVSPSPVTDNTRSLFPDAGPYLRQQLGLATHESVGLRSLPNPAPGEKPSTPLPMLIKLAIYGSPTKQLTLQEIYSELENRFQWFRDHKHERAWKNSIRHNLSLNKVFRHVPRPITEPGKGSYWRLNVSEGEGYKRPRKRRPKHRMIGSEEEDEAASEMDDDRPSPLDFSQHAGPSRSSATPVEDVHIDPELRSEGHVVGEGRTRSTTRRGGGGSPYPQQSPRYQQGQLPVVAGQDASASGQPSHRFGQPSFGFPIYSQAQPMSAAPSTSSFTDMPSSSSTTMALTIPTVTRPQLQHVAAYDRTVQVPQLTPRSGIEYVMDSEGLPVARRLKTHPESQGQSQLEGNAQRSSPESSSSGSSRTWNDARSRSQ